MIESKFIVFKLKHLTMVPFYFAPMSKSVGINWFCQTNFIILKLMLTNQR